jgi:hypothetical protein
MGFSCGWKLPCASLRVHWAFAKGLREGDSGDTDSPGPGEPGGTREGEGVGLPGVKSAAS